jgi:hypothetical protein
MPKSDFIPTADNHFLVWLDRFIANLSPRMADYALGDDDLAELKAFITDFHHKIASASDAAAAAKQATADKNDSRQATESKIRALVREK